MIKHVVFFRLHDEAEGHTKLENAQIIRDGLLALKDKIETYKIIRDDKLWIIRNGKIYSAQGQLIALRISTR